MHTKKEGKKCAASSRLPGMIAGTELFVLYGAETFFPAEKGEKETSFESSKELIILHVAPQKMPNLDRKEGVVNKLAGRINRFAGPSEN